MTAPVKPIRTPAKSGADYRLILSNLERQILKGGNDEKARKILAMEGIWKRLDPELMTAWASLCRMAGCIATAESVYGEIHRIDPGREDAWEQHLEMADILGKTPDLIRLLETAKQAVRPETYRIWAARFSRRGDQGKEKDIDQALKPFEEMRSHEHRVARFMDLFSGRPDCFARQWADRTAGKSGYVPVRHPIRQEDLDAHLKGHETLGIYLIHRDGSVKTAVIDADLSPSLRDPAALKANFSAVKKESTWMASRIIELSPTAGVRPLIENSGGKGFHFWYFFESPVPAGRARAALTHIVNRIKGDLSHFRLEVFPKQDHLSGQGLGNLVKLPLGIHRKTGKRSYFPECPDRGTAPQLAFLDKITPGMPGPVPEPSAKIEIHPKFAVLSGKWPELATLSSACPPLGKLVTACFSRNPPSFTEEQVLYQTLGFLPRAGLLLHAVFGDLPDYNPHLVDLKLSRVKGTPLGCRRIHTLLGHTGDLCPFPNAAYPSPVIHLGLDPRETGNRSESVSSLQGALTDLKRAVERVERFLK
jgi:hypothetical protein